MRLSHTQTGFSKSNGTDFVHSCIPILKAYGSFLETETRSKVFQAYAKDCACDLNGRRCVLDGEIVCLYAQGKPQFRDLLFRRPEPMFYAFDISGTSTHCSDDEEEMRSFRS